MDFNLGMVKIRPTKTQHMIYILVFFRVTIDFDFLGQHTHIYLSNAISVIKYILML